MRRLFVGIAVTCVVGLVGLAVAAKRADRPAGGPGGRTQRPLPLASAEQRAEWRAQYKTPMDAWYAENKPANAGSVGSRARKPVEGRASAGKRAFGTVQYDDGEVDGISFVFSYTIGNQFNTVNGAALIPNTVSTVTFYLASLTGTSAWVSFYGPVNGTTAPVLLSTPVGGLGLGFNTVGFSPAVDVSGGSSFLGGIWNLYSPFFGTGDGVGLDDSTVNGQGYHGIAINDIFGTDFYTLGSNNAIFRATGDIVPVELMDFETKAGQ